jgi:ABC-type glycerol-3-phosphate transport system permease component
MRIKRVALAARAGQGLSIAVLLLLTVFPFYMLVIASLKDRDQMINQFWTPALPFHFNHYMSAWLQVWPYLLHSLLITSGLIALVLLNSILAGYAFARFQFFGKTVLFYLILMLMMVPGFLLLIPQFILFKHLGLINTLAAQILGPMAGASSMATLLMRTFFEGIARGMMEAAELEGAGEWKILTRIVLPLSLPVVSTVAVIQALLGWNNYIWPLVITSGNKVKPVILSLSGITGPMDHVQGIQLAGYVIASLPLLVLFLAATRTFVSGITAGAMKS